MSDNQKLGFTVTKENGLWVVSGVDTTRVLTEAEEQIPDMRRAQDIAVKLKALSSRTQTQTRLSQIDLNWLEKNKTEKPKTPSVIPSNPDLRAQKERSLIKGARPISPEELLFKATDNDTQVGIIAVPEGTKNITIRLTEKGDYELAISALTSNERSTIINSYKNAMMEENPIKKMQLMETYNAMPIAAFNDTHLILNKRHLSDMGNQINIEIPGGKLVEFEVTGTQKSTIVPIAIYNRRPETGITFAGDTSTLKLYDENQKNKDALEKRNSLKERQAYRKEEAERYSGEIADGYAELNKTIRMNKLEIAKADEDSKIRARKNVFDKRAKGELQSQKVKLNSPYYGGFFRMTPDQPRKSAPTNEHSTTILQTLIEEVNTVPKGWASEETGFELKSPPETPKKPQEKPAPNRSKTSVNK